MTYGYRISCIQEMTYGYRISCAAWEFHTPKNVRKVCPFPLVTRALEVVGGDSVIPNSDQLEKLKRFHQYLVEDVLLLLKTRGDFEYPDLGLLIVPYH